MVRTLAASTATLLFGGLSLVLTCLPSPSISASLNHRLRSPSLVDSQTPIHRAFRASTADTMSQNWAGLVQMGSQETSIAGSWTTPTTFTSSPTSKDAIAEWVGMGGFQSTSLIQVGTITTPDAQGNPVTAVFWENLPSAASVGVTVPQGTTVDASITPDGTDQWVLSLTDGNSTPLVNQVVTLTSSESEAVETSADWITEAPTVGNEVVPLAPVASTTMQNLSANGSSLANMGSATLESIGLQDGTLTAIPTVNTAQDTLTVQVAGTATSPPSGSLAPSGYPSPGRNGGNPWHGFHHGWGRGQF